MYGARSEGKLIGEPVEIGLGPPVFDAPNPVDVPLNEVTAETSVGAKRPLEIHPRALRDPPEGRDAQRFRTNVGAKGGAFDRRGRETNAVHGDAVAQRKFRGQRRFNPQAGATARRCAVRRLRRRLQRGP
jgi:hypothetical protein